MAATLPSKQKHPLRKVLDFLSGYHLASALILLLGVLTWLGTLEQVDLGLYEVKRKYFSASNPFLVPKYNGYTIPIILPNAYWVGMLFFVNLLLGTIFRARWRWASSGTLIAHGGMLLMLLGAFVTQHWSTRGNMAINEGETSDVAQHYFDHVIEVTEMEGSAPSKVHVIETKHLKDLDPEDTRLFRMENLPFDLKVEGYQSNARPVTPGQPRNGDRGTLVDGYHLEFREDEVESERNMGGCKVTVLNKQGEKIDEFLVWLMAFHPATVRVEDKFYTVKVNKSSWKMPFEVHLTDFTHEYHPGTMRPKRFESEVERIERGQKEHVLIKMNEPMRRDGLTFFQASWGPQNARPGQDLFSVFEVVKNPADKWPEISMWIVGIGLLIQFGMKLVMFIYNQAKRDV